MKKEKRLYSALVNALVACIALIGTSQLALSEISVKDSLTALSNYVCYWEYWGGFDAKLGETVTVMLNRENDGSYAWIENMEHERSTSPHWANYFTIADKGKFSVVTNLEGFNIDVQKGRRYYEELRKKLLDNPKIEAVQWKTPDHCILRYDPDSPEKQKMLSIILHTTHDELLGFNKLHSFQKYPARTRIVISNFNIDYPEALVFVPHTNEVFSLPLHYDNESFEKELHTGSYNFGQIYDKGSIDFLKKKILENGIPFELDLKESSAP